jgi:YegS/Rv2252/BmrU family lipid kinase
VAQRTLVIANPWSRNGATGRRWQGVEARVREVLGPVEVEHTRGPRDAERIAREAARAGVERILVAGGDGTLSEVASGLVAACLADRVEIGVLPLGTGGDFLRSADLPRDLEGALSCIAAGATRSLDAGRVRFLGHEGEPREACFVNVSSFGISGLTDEIVNQTTKVFGGTVSFLIGTIRAILQYQSENVRVIVDGEVAHDGPLVLATAANGRFFGGGMRVAPEAEVDDGLFDVVILSQLSIAELLRKLPLIYRGTHLGDPAVSLWRGRVVEAQAPPGRVKLELDGEPLGSLPATWELLPGVLTLLGPAV